MNGQLLYNLCVQILNGEKPSVTYFLQLFNLSKMMIESGINPASGMDAGSRPWKVLSTKNTGQTVTGSNTYLNDFDLPDDFQRYLGESSLSQGSIVLFDGNNNIQYLNEIPIEEILNYKNEFGRFAVDYGNKKFYITGVVPGTFTIYQFYIQTTPDITLAAAWQKIPARFHSILAYDACARWRLGTDYDDVNARNADDNIKMANNIFNAMASWDTELAISAVNSMDYKNDKYGGNFGTNFPGPRGVRANY